MTTPSLITKIDTLDGADHLAALYQQFAEHRRLHIGFPGSTDFDYSALAPFFNCLINNVGDPETRSLFRTDTKHLERDVVGFLAELFRAPHDDRWGYVTAGGSRVPQFVGT